MSRFVPSVALFNARPAADRATRRAGTRALGWLAITALALWPHWLWAARRLADGSDDALGVAALAVLVCTVWQIVPQFRRSAAPGWAGTAALAALAATLAHLAAAPPLFALALAALAMAATLCAFLPSGLPRLPLIGLAVLGLPLIASLQFYAGYPLRVATAELSAWLLQAFGHSVQRSGTALWMGQKLVIVDAPCSGVQMVWMAYFCACSLAWLRQLADREFARRLAGVGAIVLAGNVVRNSVLVVLEAGATAPSTAVHETVGLVVLASVCAAVLRLVRGGNNATR